MSIASSSGAEWREFGANEANEYDAISFDLDMNKQDKHLHDHRLFMVWTFQPRDLG